MIHVNNMWVVIDTIIYDVRVRVILRVSFMMLGLGLFYGTRV
jgi:hypothetical protein